MVLLAFALTFAPGCARPSSGGAGTATWTPARALDTASEVLTQLRWIVPAVLGVTQALPLDVATQADLRNVFGNIVLPALGGLDRVVTTYANRGGGSGDCELYAASGALTQALVETGQALRRADYQTPAEVVQVAATLGGVLDELPPRCATGDAGFRATGQERAVTLQTLQRDPVLRPFPPLRP